MSELLRQDVPPEGLAPSVGRLLSEGFRLALVAAHDDGDRLRIVYLLTAGPPDRRRELSVEIDPRDPRIPSLAAISFPASRFEREMRDLFGIEPAGHPDPRGLVAHQHWPDSWHPMRRGSGPPPPMRDEGEPYPFIAVEGAGVYEIPVGPVHAGLIEPGHFRFSVVGETILNMTPRLWFTHKGTERLFEGRVPGDGVELAERISGDTAVGHTMAFCAAIEDATECAVPTPVMLARAFLLELERLYNHAADIGALCNDVGYGIAYAHAMRVREGFLRLNARVTGHRLLRGGVLPGGAHLATLPEVGEIAALVDDLRETADIALKNTVVVDRFEGTGVLDRETASALGTLGYVARASGISFDARIAHPVCDLGAFEPPVHGSGDVLARFDVRVRETEASLEMIRSLLPQLRAGRSGVALPAPQGRRAGVGIVEGWRGCIVHRVEIVDGTLARVKIVDPSFLNWAAVPAALKDTIVPDFPLINKSFNLSYSGNDL